MRCRTVRLVSENGGEPTNATHGYMIWIAHSKWRTDMLAPERSTQILSLFVVLAVLVLSACGDKPADTEQAELTEDELSQAAAEQVYQQRMQSPSEQALLKAILAGAAKGVGVEED